MSDDEAWNYVTNFRNIENPESQDIVNLDIYMQIILKSLDIETHSDIMGYSVRFPRYSKHYPQLTPNEEVKALWTHYWGRKKEADRLHDLIKKKEREIQRNCEHEWERDWSDRGHRSHHECKKCGAYR